MKRPNCFKGLSWLISLICLWGCMDIRAVDKRAGTNKDPSNPLRDFQVIAGSEMNVYRILFRRLPDSRLRLERELLGLGGAVWSAPSPSTQAQDSSNVQPLKLNVMGGQAEDPLVRGGNTYRYHLVDPGTGRRLEGQFVDVKVPRDLRLKGEVTAESQLGEEIFSLSPDSKPCGRLVFEDKAVLITNGRTLKLECQSIDFGASVVRTFPVGSQAAKATDPVDGGQIEIISDIARGQVQFDLSGRKGAAGTPGKKPDAKMKGGPGASGKPAEWHPSVCPGGGILCGVCTVNPTNGEKGKPGQKGHPGGPGGRGGNTARLILKIKNSEGFSQTVAGLPGQGGQGGAGGKGGQGGPGGKAGSFGLANQCVFAKNGPQGDEGQPGATGRSGDDGKTLSVYEWRNGVMVELKRGDLP